MQGFPGGTFQPNSSVTRAQFAAMVDAALGLSPYDPAQPTFSDVPPSYWGYVPIETAARAGIVHGVGGGRFDPGALISRQDMTIMLVNAMHLASVAQDLATSPLPFRDASAVAPWAAGAVATASSLHLVNGLPGGDFQPLGDATRAQAAQVVYNLLQLPSSSVTALAASVARSIVIETPTPALAVGQTEQVTATVYDGQGQPLPVQPAWSATGGSISSRGVFTGTQPGPAVLVASISGPNRQVRAQAVVRVVGPPAALAFPTSQLPPATAGTQVTVAVDVYDQGGDLVTGDAGRSINLEVTDPQGNSTLLTATDQGGVAAFSLRETKAGIYTLDASTPGLQAPAAAIQLTVQPGPPAKLRLSASSTSLSAAGQTAQVSATLTDAYGNPLSTSFPVAVSASATTYGTLTLPSTDQGPGNVATFTAGSQPGSTTLTVTDSQGNIPAAAVTVENQAQAAPQAPSPAALAFSQTSFGSTAAGGTLNVTVQVVSGSGTVMTSDSGRQISLTVTTPDYHDHTFTTTDQNGMATFTVGGQLAGSYRVRVASSGLTSPTPASFQVVPGPPVGLQLFSEPSVLVVPGQETQLAAAVVDAYGNPTSLSTPVQLAAGTKAYGTFTQSAQSIQGGTTVLGTFKANGQSGSTTFTLTAPGTPYGPVSLTIQTYSSSAQLVSGKGMWLMYQDWQNITDSQILATAQADHITHLYLEVATSTDGFYGQAALSDLLPKAHADHIALIAWIYATLDNPAADAQLATQVANYTAPSGDKVDGLAIDMEQTLSPSAITAFAQQVRGSVGNNYLLAAVVYPPQSDPGQTYASMYAACAQSFSVIAPMDYWHNTPTSFTAQQAADYVTQSLTMLRQLSGNPNVPISVIGQAYDMFASGGTGEYNPTGAEEQAAMQAARSGGAIGYSMYRWGTANQAEWQVFQDFNW